MYCPKCGTGNPDNAPLCSSCGWVLSWAPTPPEKFFNLGEVFGYGWRTMKANLWFFVGLGFVWLIITISPDIARFILIRLHLPKTSYITLRVLLHVLELVIGTVLGIGLIKIALSFCNERKPAIGTLFDAWDCFWRYVGAGILYGLIMLAVIVPCALAAGLLAAIRFPFLLLLIIPVVLVFAVRFAIQFGLCYYFVIDKGLGPVQALKASSRTTMGVKWQLFGFGILCFLINLLGLLCLLVGVFAAYPTVIVANALVYRQLLAQTPELAEFGIATPSVEPAPESQPNEQEF